MTLNEYISGAKLLDNTQLLSRQSQKNFYIKKQGFCKPRFFGRGDGI